MHRRQHAPKEALVGAEAEQRQRRRQQQKQQDLVPGDFREGSGTGIRRLFGSSALRAAVEFKQAGRGAQEDKGGALPHTEVPDTVDFNAPQGFLWQPTSLGKLNCPSEEPCQSTVRFCLMSVGDYQANPWKFPMAAMLQKHSKCNTIGNSRTYALSTLRVRRERESERGGRGRHVFG